MAKVRVPREKRPPTRFGQIMGGEYSWVPKVPFKVSGTYRTPKRNEFFWDAVHGKVNQAAFNFDLYKAVILEPA